MHMVSNLLKRQIVPQQRRPRLCCWFTGPNDIGRIQHGPGTDLSWDELAVLVGGITGETFVPESLILPLNIPMLCDDPGLRTTILATLPTLDDSGVAVRQTGGQDSHRGIRISDAPVGGPQPTGLARNANPAVAPSPLDKGKGAASGASASGSFGGSEEERRRRLRRTDGSLVLKPPRRTRRLQVGPRRPAPKPTTLRGASVLRSRRHHHHLGVITLGTPATAIAAAAGAAIASLPGSLEGPVPQVSVVPFSLSLIIMPTSLNPSSVFQGFFPLCSQGHASSARYQAHRWVWLSAARIC
jgi:hypothetical protein